MSTILEPGSAFVAYMKEQPHVMAKVGGAVNPRIYPNSLKQKSTLSAIVYQVIYAFPEHHLLGIAGMCTSRLRLRFYGAEDDRDEAFVLSEMIRLLLLQGGGRRLWGPLIVKGVKLDMGPFDDSDVPQDGSDNWRPNIVCDYEVVWKQPQS